MTCIRLLEMNESIATGMRETVVAQPYEQNDTQVRGSKSVTIAWTCVFSAAHHLSAPI